jgi:uncharacterized protein YjbJ (UPF0337 family)
MLKQFVSPDVFGDLDSRRMWTDGNQGAALMELLPFCRGYQVICENCKEGQYNMDKDRIAGSAKQAKGAVKEVAGKVAGDAKLQSEGKSDKVAGKVQNAVGGIKDAVRGK